jgi:NAD(P)-dependent dehydrogenase (short-subunit alcohol dehydrogenase family)
MEILLAGPATPLEAALTARGFRVTRAGTHAECLVTTAPPVETEPLAAIDPAAWRRTFDAWAKEAFFAAQPWLAAALQRGSGSWVAVTSVVGVQPFPGAGAAGAGAMALHTLVRIAALEGGPRGVRANVVAPGWSGDDLPATLDPDLAVADTPLRRLSAPADVAGAVAWLLSPDAAHVSGEILRVDGGYAITRGSRPDPRRR